MICQNPICKQEIEVTAGYFMLAFDRPYINLYFHPKCIVEDAETLLSIIAEQFKQPVIKVKRNNF